MITTPMATGQGGGVDSSFLELLGKRAASLHLEGGMDPGDAVVKVASDEAASGKAFTTEHLRRITEHANTGIHQQLFEKEADKTFTFPLADPERVIQDLGSQAVHKVPVPSARDAVAAAMPKVSSPFFPGQDTVVLEAGFRVDTPAEDYPEHNPVGQLQILSDKVHGVEDEVLAKKAGVEVLLEETQNALFHHIKQASLYGLTLRDIYSALVETGSDKLAQAACDYAHQELQKDLQYQLTDQTVKTASGALNPEHPLVQSFVMVEHLSTKLAGLNQAAKIAAEQRADVDKRLHDRLRHVAA
jgi:hypothetical protein